MCPCPCASQAPRGLLVGWPPQMHSLVGGRESSVRHVLSKASARWAASGWGRCQQKPKCGMSRRADTSPARVPVLSALRSVPPSSSLSSGHSLVRGALRLQETSRLRGVRPVCPFWPPHAVGSGLCSAHRHGPMDCLSHRPPPLCLCRLGLARGGLVAGGNEAPDGLPL